MKLRRLHTKDYRAYTTLDWSPGPQVNLVYGPSMEGKSTLMAALEYLLAGRNEWTDGGGHGIDTQVRLGCPKAAMFGEFDGRSGDFAIERLIPPEPGVKKVQARIDSWLNLPPDFVRATVTACVRHDGFLEFSHQEQKDLLFSIYGTEFTHAHIVAGFEAFAPGQGLPAYYGKHRASITATADPFDRVSMRVTALGREVTKLEAQVAGFRAQSTTTPYDREEHERLLAQKAKLQADIAGQGAPDQVAQEKHRLAVAAYDREKKTYEAAAWAHTKALTKEAGLHEALKTDRASLAQAMGFLGECKSAAAITMELESRQAQLVDLAAVRAKILAQMQSKETCPPGTCARVLSSQWGAELAALEARSKTHQDMVDSLRAMAQTRKDREGHRAMLESRIRETETTIQSLAAPAPTEPTHPGPAPTAGAVAQSLRTALSDMETRLERKECDKAAWQAAESNRKLADAKGEELAGLQAEAATCQLLKTALGPSGIRARLIESKIRTFEADVSTICAEWGAPTVRVDTDHPVWQLLARLPGGEIPATQCSTSQQHLISAAIQITLATVTGFGVIALDGIEVADPLFRGAVVDYLLDRPDLQAFILCVAQATKTGFDGEPEFALPKAIDEPELAMWWVFDGAVYPIKPAPASDAIVASAYEATGMPGMAGSRPPGIYTQSGQPVFPRVIPPCQEGRHIVGCGCAR